MTTVFADTLYYVALVNAGDQFHAMARDYTADFGGRMVTTAWVVTEVANMLARTGSRGRFLLWLQDLQTDPRVTIVPPTPLLFDQGCSSTAGAWTRTGR